MTKAQFLTLSLLATFASCNLPKENARLKQQVDSLKVELETNQNVSAALQDVGTMIDSIDVNRHLLRTKMVEGTSVDDFKTRMKDINDYVKNAERKITSLEKSLVDSRASGRQYTTQLKKLRAELEDRNKELVELQEKVNLFQNENSNLIQTVNLQKAEIEDKLSQIETKRQETEKLQSEVSQLITQSKVDEADAYYAKGVLLEETAKRTKFAPRKKKETNRKALDMYELAALCGKEEAAAKVEELKKKVL